MATATTNANGQAAKTSDIDELQQQIAALKSDIAALSGTMKDIGTKRAAALREQGEAQIARARAKGEEAYGAAEQSVRDNPAMAVGIAAGIGFLTGIILGRK